jgi:hypothetical protein
MTSPLSDAEYELILKELDQWNHCLDESERLAQDDTMEKAAQLYRLFSGPQWVAEREAEPAQSDITSKGKRPIDPASRNQFAAWVERRYRNIGKRRTYQLLDAKELVDKYLNAVQILPTRENQVRPLKKWTSTTYGSGVRIAPAWERACRISAEQDYTQPTARHVTEGMREWEREHCPPREKRKHRAAERAASRKSTALSAWRALCDTRDAEQIAAFRKTVEADIAKIRDGKSWAS